MDLKANKRIGYFLDSDSEIAIYAYQELSKKYQLLDADVLPADSLDVIITLGGDGIMLKALHKFMHDEIPVFGMNRGSIGFLLNEYSKENLYSRLDNAVTTVLHPLEMSVTTVSGQIYNALAVNEVSLLREAHQSAKIKISINDEVRLDYLVADGVLVSTPAGSTAYNFAAHGPIVPLDARLLTLTPISPFRPRRWGSALISHRSKVRFDVIEVEKRPVSAVADSFEIRDVASVSVIERSDIKLKLLFDAHNIFEERVLKEQFAE